MPRSGAKAQGTAKAWAASTCWPTATWWNCTVKLTEFCFETTQADALASEPTAKLSAWVGHLIAPLESTESYATDRNLAQRNRGSGVFRLCVDPEHPHQRGTRRRCLGGVGLGRGPCSQS